MPTPEQERGRIAGVYSAMSDEELGQIADSGDELSAIAQEAFQTEVARRGLKITIAPPSGEDVFEFNETVTLRQFRDLPDALLAKGQSGVGGDSGLPRGRQHDPHGLVHLEPSWRN